MARLVKIPKHTDPRGSLCVIENMLPFDIKRTYYMYDVVGKRGGHRHKKSHQALICLGGSCEIYVNNGEKEELFQLNDPELCLLLEPRDWHTMDTFSQGAILLVMASTTYDVSDYIDEPYND